MSPLVFALCSLAAWRLAALIASDTITASLRARTHRWLAELVNCGGRCLPVWTAAACVAYAHAAGLAPSRAACLLAWPAAAGAAALLDRWDAR